MLTPASATSTPLTYETAQEDFAHASREVQDDGVDETIDITQRIREALPVRIPPLSEKQLEQAMSIIPPDGPKFRCWFCREQGHTMYTCPYLTVAQQRYCAYQNYIYSESRAETRGTSTGPRRVEPARNRVERAVSPRGDTREGRRELRFSDTRPARILRRNGDQAGGRQAPRPVLALPPAELETPAPVPNATVLLEEEDSESSVDVPTTSCESGKD